MIFNKTDNKNVYFDSTNGINTQAKDLDLEIFELFIDDLVDIDTAFDDILEKARKGGQDPFSICDRAQLALAKPFNKTQLSQIEKLNAHIQNSINGEKAFQILAEKIKNKSPDIQYYFVQNIKNLKLFLAGKHKEMLALAPAAAGEKQEEFRQIKRTFRDLFLSFAKDKMMKESYDKSLRHNFGRQDSNSCRDLDGFLCFFGKEHISEDFFDSIAHFMDELIQFRKNYSCRYSIHKVKNIIEDKIKQIRCNLFDNESTSDMTKFMIDCIKNNSVSITDETLSLLKTTFFHGTHSAILPYLPLSDMKLIPIAHLLRQGIIPLSGELQEGAVLDERSTKYSQTSATTLDDGFRAMDYSHSFHSNVNYEKQLVNVFLKILENQDCLKDQSSVCDTQKWARYSIAILRVRLLDEQFFNEHKEKLSAGIEQLRQNFDFFKTTDDYKSNMPKSLDPDGLLGYGHHDEYWYCYINKCQMNLDNLQKALIKPLKTLEKVTIVDKPFSIIFGSTNLHTRSYSARNNLERRTQKFCLLGKEIDFLSVKKENIDEINVYLKEHDLEEKVKIVDRETLQDAMLLNQLASHYFADFASRKKLAKIFNEDSVMGEDIDQVQHTLSEKLWNTCMVFADQIWDQ